MDLEKHDREFALSAMKWYGWGSPIGLTVFFLGIACCVFIIRKAFFA